MALPTQIDLAKAQALVSAIEADNQEQARKILDELNDYRESELYQEVSELTHHLHKTLDELGDQTLLMQTKHDIPDAAERLEYVMQATENASKETLDKAELALQNLDVIQNQLQAILTSEARAELAEPIEKIHHSLTEIMLAQSYQDLTGQVLNRVILIISSLEQSLVQLIEHSSYDYHAIPEREVSDEQRQEQDMKGSGPVVTQNAKKEAIQTQEDIDDLLDDLGI